MTRILGLSVTTVGDGASGRRSAQEGCSKLKLSCTLFRNKMALQVEMQMELKGSSDHTSSYFKFIFSASMLLN